MIWFGISIIIFVYFVVRGIKSKLHWRDLSFCMFIGLFPCIFLSFAFSGICSGITDNITQPELKHSISFEKRIYAIQDNSSIEGQIKGNGFVKRVHIDEVEYYHYISDGVSGKKTEKVPVNSSYLIETGDDFHIEVWTTSYKHQWIRLFTLRDSIKTYYKIYVPYGTITTDYNIDLQY